MIFHFWARVVDCGSTLKQHWFNVLCLFANFADTQRENITVRDMLALLFTDIGNYLDEENIHSGLG